MCEIVIFLGPTVSREEARGHLDAHYLPPVSQGDIVSILPSQPRAIGIIDGYFQLVPAVWHKEILLAIDQGVTVAGAASMGALRAAELEAFGMLGVGRIFRWYRDGFLEADDEVAVTHGPHELGYRCLSEAMVNIRATLDAAVRRGDCSLSSAAALVAACAETPYWQRSYSRLIRDGRRLGLPESELAALEKVERIDQKRSDAIALLDLLANTASIPRGKGRFKFNLTSKCARLMDRDICLSRAGDRRLTSLALVDFYRLEGNRLGIASKSLGAARSGAKAGDVIALLRQEGRFEAVLCEAVASDHSDGMRPCEGDDNQAFESYCQRVGVDGAVSLSQVATKLGFDDRARFLERLHRFNPTGQAGEIVK